MNLTITPEGIDGRNINRVVQLINKTNQFNLTTRRYDADAVKKFSGDEDVFFRCYDVEDRVRWKWDYRDHHRGADGGSEWHLPH